MNYKFNKNRKDATEFTKKNNQEVYNKFDFDAQLYEFEDVKKGLVEGTVQTGDVKDENGNIVWSFDEGRYNKVDLKDAPETVNPSLWRHAKLEANNGIYKIGEGAYQVRGYDCANILFTRGENSWIAHDSLTTPALSKLAYETLCKHVEDLPISAVIYNHSHGDHYGGVKGLISEEEVRSGKVQVIAPYDFTYQIAAESVIPGNIMSRRANFHLGTQLEKDDKGVISAGMGLNFSNGDMGVIKPTEELPNEDNVVRVIDGIKFIFNQATETEAVAELVAYTPHNKVLVTGELTSNSLHQLLTLRGAHIRDGFKWAKVIDKMIRDFGDDVEVIHNTHNWPVYGNEAINIFLREQRDVYLHIHNQTMQKANMGAKIDELPYVVKQNSELEKKWHTHGYYGHLNTNTKATYQLYLGWFDGTAAKLRKYPEYETGKRWIEMFGADVLMEKAIAYFEKGDYQWVAEVMHEVVCGEPTNENAKLLLADAYEQIGYQEETGSRRNVYLQSAKELREGINKKSKQINFGLDTFMGLTPEQIFDAFGVQLLAENIKPEDAKEINFHFTDLNEKRVLELTNHMVLNSYAGESKDAKVNIELTKNDLIMVAFGIKKMEELDTFKYDGDIDEFKFIINNLVKYDTKLPIVYTEKK